MNYEYRPSPVTHVMFESEIAFVIVNRSLDIARDIAGLTSIRGYKLQTRPRLRITDTYYDTKSRLLGKKRVGLRTRKIGGDLFVSIKSSPHRIPGRGVRRNEFESPWSPESVTRMATVLGTLGVPAKASYVRGPSSTKLFARIGLEELQQRHTTRDVREVRLGGRRAPRIAEIDIDRVTFLGRPKVQIFEVEVEAKASRSWRIVQDIASELESSYSGFLRVWPYGKLVTGLAIRQLWKLGRLSGYLQNGRLGSGAFDLLDQWIGSSRLKGPDGSV